MERAERTLDRLFVPAGIAVAATFYEEKLRAHGIAQQAFDGEH